MENKLATTKISYFPNPLAFNVHTKFNVQNNPALKIIIEQIEGVEEVSINHKYSFTVFIGQLFDKQEIIAAIQQKIKEFVEE